MQHINKDKTDREIFGILLLGLRAFKMGATKKNVEFARAMFVEGTSYWRKKMRELS